VARKASDQHRDNVKVDVELHDRGDDDSPRVLVDASNVAHATEGGEARLRNIALVEQKLRDEGLEPIVVADAALRHQIDDKVAYEKLVDDGKVHQAPAGTDADYFILSFARELDARILTNDRFRDRAKDFPKELGRVIRYMIVDGEVVLEQRNQRR
jgi:Zc3h12a-like Ribonuclease NYN domain